MSDRSTNQVLFRRLGALSIDVGMVAGITALAAWAKAEKFIPMQTESGSGLPIWSTVDQARRDDIAQDSWNRMQKVGNTEYVWTRDSLLTVGLVGLGAAALVFLLIPAVIRSTIGKKIFRIRSKKKSTDTGIDGGQLDRRTSGADSETSIIDLNDRLSKTNAGASAAPSSVEGASTEPEHPAQADELFPNELASTTNPVPLAIDMGTNQVSSPDDLLPIDVVPLDGTAGAPSGDALANPTPRSVTPLTEQPIDVEAGGLLGMEVRTEVQTEASEDLPALWPNQSPVFDDADLEAPVPDDAVLDDAALPDVVSATDTPSEFVSESAVETPSTDLPDLGFRQPVQSTLSEAAIVDGDDEESQPLPPPPLHRAVKWDPPTAEPAPVWSPEAADLADSDTDLLTDNSTEIIQAVVSDAPTPVPADVGDEPPASTTPSWSKDWQAWIYWDQAHGQWLRHDVEADVWIPLS